MTEEKSKRDDARRTYVDKCRDFLCEPVKLLLDQFDQAKLELRQLEKVKLNGNSKALFNSRLEYMQIFALAEALQTNLNVTELDLSYNTIDDAGAAVIAKLLKANKRMRRLDLTRNAIGEEGAVKLLESLYAPESTATHPVASELQVLRLNGNPIGDVGGLQIAAWLRVNDHLKELDVGNCKLGIKSVVAIMAALSEANRTLTTLNIENPSLLSLGDEHNMHAAHMLASNDVLSSLYLGKVRVRDAGCETLVAYGLVPNNALTVLDLRCCDLSEEAGASLARLLYENVGLASLNLSGNRLADNGAAAIAAVLPEARTLTKLDLSFNSIHDRGLAALADGMRENHKVTRLHVWGNVWGEHSAARFAEVLAEKRARKAPVWTDFAPYPVDEHTYVAKLAAPDDRRT